MELKDKLLFMVLPTLAFIITVILIFNNIIDIFIGCILLFIIAVSARIIKMLLIKKYYGEDIREGLGELINKDKRGKI